MTYETPNFTKVYPLPDGLTDEMILTALTIVDDWEDSDVDTHTELLVALYRFFDSSLKKGKSLARPDL